MISLPRHRADYGWLAIAAGVLVYDALSSEENTLSTAMDRYIECHPWLARGIVALTTLHLLGFLNFLGPYDPFDLALAGRDKALILLGFSPNAQLKSEEVRQ